MGMREKLWRLIPPGRKYADRRFDELLEQNRLLFGEVRRLSRVVEETRNKVDRVGARTERRLDIAEKRLLKTVQRPCLEYLIVNILDHCNLRCKGCDHFACIADEYFVPYETIERDVARMAEMFSHEGIEKIGVMGGEPLLHPALCRILAYIRRCFPHTVIRLTTNGMLLLRQGDVFWETLRENAVTLVVTKYPIDADYEAVRERAAAEGVAFQYYENTGDGITKRMVKKQIDLNGTGDPVLNFSRCDVSVHCNFLMEGRFYACPFMCQSQRIFNKVFQTGLRMEETDYIDIYRADAETILRYQSVSKQYCRYCPGVVRGLDWETSRAEIGEWAM